MENCCFELNFDNDFENHCREQYEEYHMYLQELMEFSTNQIYPEIVKNAVKIDGYSLEYASMKLRDDEEIVRIAIDNNSNTFEFASNRLKDDAEMVLYAIEKNGYNYQYISERLKNNFGIALTAVYYNIDVIDFVPLKYKDEIKNILKYKF